MPESRPDRAIQNRRLPSFHPPAPVLLCFRPEVADKMIKKLIGMRISEDENGKTNLALKDVNGEPHSEAWK